MLGMHKSDCVNVKEGRNPENNMELVLKGLYTVLNNLSYHSMDTRQIMGIIRTAPTSIRRIVVQNTCPQTGHDLRLKPWAPSMGP